MPARILLRDENSFPISAIFRANEEMPDKYYKLIPTFMGRRTNLFSSEMLTLPLTRGLTCLWSMNSALVKGLTHARRQVVGPVWFRNEPRHLRELFHVDLIH